jgi:hypothetical protein
MANVNRGRRIRQCRCNRISLILYFTVTVFYLLQCNLPSAKSEVPILFGSFHDYNLLDATRNYLTYPERSRRIDTFAIVTIFLF